MKPAALLPLVGLLLSVCLAGVGCQHAPRPAVFASLDPPRLDAATPGDHQAAWRTYLSKQRELQMVRLRDYSAAGQFALNDRGAPGLQFVWRDGAGRLCAMVAPGRGLWSRRARR